MSPSAVAQEKKHAPVNMGQHVFGQAPDRFTSVLGSCIGVAFYHPRTHTGAFVHIVLPESLGRSGPEGKFADTAIPCLIRLFQQQGIPIREIVAKIAGGASMFNSKGPIQIGEANEAAVREKLAEAKIPILGEHLQGAKGRRVEFDCSTGILRVEIAGQKPVEL